MWFLSYILCCLVHLVLSLVVSVEYVHAATESVEHVTLLLLLYSVGNFLNHSWWLLYHSFDFLLPLNRALWHVLLWHRNHLREWSQSTWLRRESTPLGGWHFIHQFLWRLRIYLLLCIEIPLTKANDTLTNALWCVIWYDDKVDHLISALIIHLAIINGLIVHWLLYPSLILYSRLLRDLVCDLRLLLLIWKKCIDRDEDEHDQFAEECACFEVSWDFTLW